MKNRKTYLIAIIVIIAMMASLVIGCTGKDGNKTESNGSFNQFGVQTMPSITDGAVEIKNADKYIQFEVHSKLDKIDEQVKVQRITFDPRNPETLEVGVVSLSNDLFRIHAPNGGYELGMTYVITLGEDVNFVEYQGTKKVMFTPNVDTLSNIQFKDNTVVLNEVLAKQPSGKHYEADGTEVGNIQVQNNGKFELAEGDVFVVDRKGTQEAYKVDKLNETFDSSYFNISYRKPQIEEIYDEFEYEDVEVLDEDNIEELVIDPAKVEAQLAASPIAEAVALEFGFTPKFDVDIQLVGEEVVAKIVLTVQDAVKTNNGNANLVIVLENRITATANSNIQNNKVKVDTKLGPIEKYDVSFDVNALIQNNVSCKIGILAKVNASKAENVQDLIDSLQKDFKDVTNKDDLVSKVQAVEEITNTEEPTAKKEIKLFKWMLPIADGAATISYDADLVFTFDFAGEFGTTAKTSLKYNVGASYNITDGLDTYAKADENNKPCDELSVTIDGKAKLKVGINQRVKLDVLAGVLGIGLNANVGNFNTLYGYADAKWVANDQKELVLDQEFKGTMYLEGGIYWDVNVDFAVKIGSLVNLNKGLPVASGEKVLYTAGSNEIVRDVLVEGIEKGKTVELVAKETTLNFEKSYLDILDKTKKTASINNSDVKIEFESGYSAYAEIDGSKIILYQPEKDYNFYANISYTYTDFAGKTEIVTTSIHFNHEASIVLDKGAYAYNKDTKDVVMEVTTAEGTPSLKLNEEDVIATVSNKDNNNTYKVTINHKDLDKLNNGDNKLTVVAGALSLDVNIEISGELEAKEVDENKDGVYEIYAPDQILDLLDNNTNITSSDKFIITEDIDLTGKTIVPRKEFAGIIDGNNKKISNYTISKMTEVAKEGKSNKGYVGLIGINNGSIKDITFVGDVNIEFAAITNSDYYISGVVGVNNGVVENVVYNGKVSVYSTGLQAFSDVYVAGVVASGEKTNCVANISEMNVKYKFDLANFRFHIIDTATSFKSKCEAGNGKITIIEHI